MIKRGDTRTLQMEDLAFGGKGVAREGDFVIFVEGGLPGQEVQARITEVKKRYAEAACISVLKRSPVETEVPYQPTPGAVWIRLPVEVQLRYKQQQILELFKRIAHIDLVPLLDTTIASPRTWFYRNKMEFSFGPDTEMMQEKNGKKEWTHSGFALGSKKRGQYWLTENLDRPSGLFDEETEIFLPTLRAFCEQTGLPVFNQKTNQGFFQQLLVRKSFAENTLFFQLSTTAVQASHFPEKEFVTLLQNTFSVRLAGVCWICHNVSENGAVNRTSRKILCGQDRITERILGLDFEISPESFFQTNPATAELLYQRVGSYVSLRPGDQAIDLYCGTGTIAQVIASQFPATQVLGVEIVPSAVADARANAQRNRLSNISFFCEDVRFFLKQHPELVGTIQSVVLDPPRAGLAPKALQRAIDLGAQTIVYVSCNPATMARDTETICHVGYQLRRFSIVDQFPHTHHIECIGQFVKG